MKIYKGYVLCYLEGHLGNELHYKLTWSSTT
jgi:hypothetical protein